MKNNLDPIVAYCGEKISRAKELVWHCVFFLKLAENAVMALSLGLALDTIANGAVQHWTNIQLVFMANIFIIVVNTISMIYHAKNKKPLLLTLLSPISGGLVFTFISQYVYDLWFGMHIIMIHDQQMCTSLTQGVYQLKIMAAVLYCLPAMFAIDSICSLVSKPSRVSPRMERRCVKYQRPSYSWNPTTKYNRLSCIN